jgi:hypothetical protein
VKTSTAHPRRTACLLGAAATAALVCGLAAPSTAQTRCDRDGDWLVCEDGRRYAIRVDPFTRARVGGARGAPRVPGDEARHAGTPDPGLLVSSDGLVCWPHGDHAHCQ